VNVEGAGALHGQRPLGQAGKTHQLPAQTGRFPQKQIFDLHETSSDKENYGSSLNPTPPKLDLAQDDSKLVEELNATIQGLLRLNIMDEDDTSSASLESTGKNSPAELPKLTVRHSFYAKFNFPPKCSAALKN